MVDDGWLNEAPMSKLLWLLTGLILATALLLEGQEIMGGSVKAGGNAVIGATPVAGGTVTHDTACSVGAASGTSLSVTCVPTGGTDTGLVVGLSFSTKTVTSIAVTWNGVSLTQVGSNCINASNSEMVAQFALINPASGSHSLAVSWTTAAIAVMGGEFVTNANQTTMTTGSTCNTSAASVTPQTVTTSPGPASGDLIIDTVALDSGAACGTAGATQRWAIRQSFTVGGCGQTSTSNPLTWTGVSSGYEDIALNIKHD